ncbi:putative pterin-binding protein [Pseudomonas sp. XS1P51]
MKSRLYCYCSFLLIVFYLLSPILLARAEDDIQQKIALKLSWRDDQGKPVDKAFSLSDLELMAQTAIMLELPESLGVAGEHTWQGVPLRSLIALSGRRADSVTVSALNGYSVIVPGKDIERFNPTLAYRRDGVLMSVREKGPFMLIYPFNRFSELNWQIYVNRQVWQVNEITLQ